MPTNKLGLPTITGNLTADVVRDMNALAQAVDDSAGVPDGLAILGPNGKLAPGQENTLEIKDATTTQKGITQLSDATNSTSIILAATANAVKKVWDLANGKYSKPVNGIPKADLDTTVQASLGKADASVRVKLSTINLSQNPSALVNLGGLSNYKDFIVILENVVHNSGTTNAINATINNLTGTTDYMVLELDSTPTLNNRSNFASLASWGQLPLTGAIFIDYEGSLIAMKSKIAQVSVNNSLNISSFDEGIVRNTTINLVDSIQIKSGSGQLSGGIIELWGVLK